MLLFSENTAWVTAWVTVEGVEAPLRMSMPLVLKLATIHYYAENTFSYISLPMDTFESLLIDYHLIYMANKDVQYPLSYDDDSAGHCRWERVQLALTVAGWDFLRKVPLVSLVAELVDHQFSPNRAVRFFPYGEASNDVYHVALKYMEGLTLSDLPQFLSHEISSIREKARELLTN